MTSYPIEANKLCWWLTTVASWSHLHAIPRAAVDPADEDTVEALCGGPWPVLTAVCGCTAEWTMPGMFSRMGMARCARCCRKLGIAEGDGTPANETASLPLSGGEP
jgi:hypothetical protein